ncbi:MAG: zinc-ribbon domain-containing protein [Deltaproteobacteria bacterium]
MNCPKCNQEMADNANFCPNCGEKTAFEDSPEERNDAIEVITKETERAAIQETTNIRSANKATEMWNRMNKNTKVVSICAVCVLLVLSYTLFIYRDSDGYNIFGYDKYGYDQEGLDKHGYNEDGYNRDGYDKDGYDEWGWNAEGINQDTGTNYNSDGYDKDGYDKDGYDSEGFDKQGINKDTGTTYNIFGLDVNGDAKPNPTIAIGTNGSELEYVEDEVTEGDATALANYLTNLGWGSSDSNAVYLRLSKDGNVYQLHVVLKDGLENDQDAIDRMQVLATLIGQNVFGAECDILLCNDNGRVLRTVVGY